MNTVNRRKVRVVPLLVLGSLVLVWRLSSCSPPLRRDIRFVGAYSGAEPRAQISERGSASSPPAVIDASLSLTLSRGGAFELIDRMPSIRLGRRFLAGSDTHYAGRWNMVQTQLVLKSPRYFVYAHRRGSSSWRGFWQHSWELILTPDDNDRLHGPDGLILRRVEGRVTGQ